MLSIEFERWRAAEANLETAVEGDFKRAIEATKRVKLAQKRARRTPTA